ncbi:MAG: hypothetical protein M3N28_04825, partial [Actinomycetota bacterium]|nr:hypothetical protein [Actinomycetota bacterium]
MSDAGRGSHGDEPTDVAGVDDDAGPGDPGRGGGEAVAESPRGAGVPGAFRVRTTHGEHWFRPSAGLRALVFGRSAEAPPKPPPAPAPADERPDATPRDDRSEEADRPRGGADAAPVGPAPNPLPGPPAPAPAEVPADDQAQPEAARPEAEGEQQEGERVTGGPTEPRGQPEAERQEVRALRVEAETARERAQAQGHDPPAQPEA